MSDNSIKLKIGYVVKMFPRLSETFILNEMIELERKDVEVTVFSLKKPNEGRFHPQLSRLKAKVYYLEDLDSKKFPIWIGKDWSNLGEAADRIWPLLKEALSEGDNQRVEHIWWSVWIAARINQLGITRLHAHFASLPSTIADLAGRIANVPYSFTAHAKDIYVYDMFEHRLKEKLGTSQFVVTVTDFNRKFLIEQGGNELTDKIRLIHNGIDLNRFSQVDQSERDSNLILAVGRLVPKKGFDDLLRACKILKDANKSFRCVIVGDGPDSEALIKLRTELQLENEVTLTGSKNSDEVNQLLKQATMFCLPCKAAEDGNIDALPTVLLEALATGLPAISTTLSGIPEIIDSGKDGLLVEANDYQALAEAMIRLLNDAPLRKKFAVNGRQKAEEKFDIRLNVKTLLDTFMNHSGGLGKTKPGATARSQEVVDASE